MCTKTRIELETCLYFLLHCESIDNEDKIAINASELITHILKANAKDLSISNLLQLGIYISWNGVTHCLPSFDSYAVAK